MGSLMLQILLVLTVFAATSSGRRKPKPRPRPEIVHVGPVLPPLDPNDPNYFNPQGSAFTLPRFTSTPTTTTERSFLGRIGDAFGNLFGRGKKGKNGRRHGRSVDGIHEEYIGIGDNGYEGIGYRNKYREPWYMKEWKRWDGEK